MRKLILTLTLAVLTVACQNDRFEDIEADLLMGQLVEQNQHRQIIDLQTELAATTVELQEAIDANTALIAENTAATISNLETIDANYDALVAADAENLEAITKSINTVEANLTEAIETEVARLEGVIAALGASLEQARIDGDKHVIDSLTAQFNTAIAALAAADQANQNSIIRVAGSIIAQTGNAIATAVEEVKTAQAIVDGNQDLRITANATEITRVFNTLTLRVNNVSSLAAINYYDIHGGTYTVGGVDRNGLDLESRLATLSATVSNSTDAADIIALGHRLNVIAGDVISNTSSITAIDLTPYALVSETATQAELDALALNLSGTASEVAILTTSVNAHTTEIAAIDAAVTALENLSNGNYAGVLSDRIAAIRAIETSSLVTIQVVALTNGIQGYEIKVNGVNVVFQNPGDTSDYLLLNGNVWTPPVFIVKLGEIQTAYDAALATIEAILADEAVLNMLRTTYPTLNLSIGSWDGSEQDVFINGGNQIAISYRLSDLANYPTEYQDLIDGLDGRLAAANRLSAVQNGTYSIGYTNKTRIRYKFVNGPLTEYDYGYAYDLVVTHNLTNTTDVTVEVRVNGVLLTGNRRVATPGAGHNFTTPPTGFTFDEIQTLDSNDLKNGTISDVQQVGTQASYIVKFNGTSVAQDTNVTFGALSTGL